MYSTMMVKLKKNNNEGIVDLIIHMSMVLEYPWNILYKHRYQVIVFAEFLFLNNLEYFVL